MHHDALELPSGEIMLLTRLREGQFATVIQLPATEHQPVATEANRTRRDERNRVNDPARTSTKSGSVTLHHFNRVDL